MALTLQKGANLSLTKEAPGLTRAVVGLGWDARSTDGSAFDLDAAALLIGADGKVRGSTDFVYYGQLADADNSVVHQGDNLTGDGDGDDEQIIVDLTKVPADVERVVFTASIYEAEKNNQSFGQVRNAFIRVVDGDSDSEVVRYDLSEDYATETALVFAELYRNNGDWKFKAVGQGYANGLAGIAGDFGVQLG
jgi:tellurium resistance protein TerD